MHHSALPWTCTSWQTPEHLKSLSLNISDWLRNLILFQIQLCNTESIVTICDFHIKRYVGHAWANHRTKVTFPKIITDYILRNDNSYIKYIHFVSKRGLVCVLFHNFYYSLSTCKSDPWWLYCENQIKYFLYFFPELLVFVHLLGFLMNYLF